MKKNSAKEKLIREYIFHFIVDLLPFLAVFAIIFLFGLNFRKVAYNEFIISGNVLWICCVYMGCMNYGLMTKVENDLPKLKIGNIVLASLAGIFYVIIKFGYLLDYPIDPLLCCLTCIIVFVFSIALYIVYIIYEIREVKA